MINTALKQCLAWLGHPAKLGQFLEANADELIGIKPPAGGSVWTKNVVSWQDWPGKSSGISSRPGEIYIYRDGTYGYRGYLEYIPALAELIRSERIAIWTCDLKDIHGLSASKSSEFDFRDLDLMVEARCAELVTDVSEAGMLNNLAHRGIGLVNGIDRDFFRSFSWEPGRLYVANGDGSHHLSAARYIARKLGLEFTLSAPLVRYWIDPTQVRRLRYSFDIFVVSKDLMWGQGGVCDLLQEMQAAYGWLDMPWWFPHKGIDPTVAVFLPCNDKRAMTTARVFARHGAFDLGAHLGLLAMKDVPLPGFQT